MATSYKTFTGNDIINSRTNLYESIPLTGSIFSGSYGAFGSETNIKNYSHGMFQSVYDYAYLSSSANHIVDITFGYSADSAFSASTPNVQQSKKINIYNQMAQVLMGYDHTGSIQKFDADGNILAGGTKLRECYFLNFARLLTKDEIKKGSFTMQIGTSSFATANNSRITITDAGAANSFFVNSPAGEYAILSASSGEAAGSTSGYCGLLFYQAGVAVLTASVFAVQPTGKSLANVDMDGAGSSINTDIADDTIQQLSDQLRHRIYNIQYNCTTELNSTIYFCRINHNDFLYSSNPTYLSGSKIRVKNSTLDQPVTYITEINLHAADGAILGSCKLSEPLKHTSDNSQTLRCRLDY